MVWARTKRTGTRHQGPTEGPSTRPELRKNSTPLSEPICAGPGGGSDCRGIAETVSRRYRQNSPRPNQRWEWFPVQLRPRFNGTLLGADNQTSPLLLSSTSQSDVAPGIAHDPWQRGTVHRISRRIASARLLTERSTTDHQTASTSLTNREQVQQHHTGRGAHRQTSEVRLGRVVLEEPRTAKRAGLTDW